MDSTISIITVCDNHFSVLLSAMLKSLETNHLSDELLDIYIVDDKIDVRNKAKINATITSSKIKLIWLKMETAIPQRWTLPLDNTDFPINVYARLFIPYFIPENIEKVIYLDVDMIVLEDISKLWYTSLNNYVIACVVDRSKVVSNKAGIPNYKELGLDPYTKYFNSGLQLINTKKWREENYTDKLMVITAENKEYILYADQYCMNVAFSNKWLELDPKWNWYASNKEIENPFIIHFVGNKPIYSSYNYSQEYKSIFYDYLSLTPWKSFKPKSKIHRKFKKISNKFKKQIIFFLRKKMA